MKFSSNASASAFGPNLRVSASICGAVSVTSRLAMPPVAGRTRRTATPSVAAAARYARVASRGNALAFEMRPARSGSLAPGPESGAALHLLRRLWWSLCGCCSLGGSMLYRWRHVTHCRWLRRSPHCRLARFRSWTHRRRWRHAFARMVWLDATAIGRRCARHRSAWLVHANCVRVGTFGYARLRSFR